MASNADITSAVTSAETLALTAAQMVSLLDRMIAEAVVDHRLTVSYTINGRSKVMGLSEARQLRDYYRSEAITEAGGLVAAPGEMVGE